ncbi:MAG: type 1 fimbrial protein [Providencia sp.]|jgi:type 1 fimbria pilin|nr:type 1 fimbrial protein [Providencia sp.]
MMSVLNLIQSFIYIFILVFPYSSFSDVLINVTSTMVDPACNIRSENGESSISINFGTLNVDVINKDNKNAEFSLYISDCNFNKNLSIIINPKGTETINYEGKKILATNISGLGIDFSEVTGGGSRYLEMNKAQIVHPERLNDTEYRVDLKTKLVSIIPTENLELGVFFSVVTITINYF